MATKKASTSTRSRQKSVKGNGRRSNGGKSRSLEHQASDMMSLEDLFKHELKDMYSAEHLLAEALSELEAESTVPELAKAFAEHRKQTEGHIARLEEVASMLDEEELEAAECHGIEGLLEEKKAFAEEHPSAEILNVFNVGAGQKSERYEITAYESLIEMAQKMGHRDAVAQLKATLAEEEAALKLLKSLGARLEAPTRRE